MPQALSLNMRSTIANDGWLTGYQELFVTKRKLSHIEGMAN